MMSRGEAAWVDLGLIASESSKGNLFWSSNGEGKVTWARLPQCSEVALLSLWWVSQNLAIVLIQFVLNGAASSTLQYELRKRERTMPIGPPHEQSNQFLSVSGQKLNRLECAREALREDCEGWVKKNLPGMFATGILPHNPPAADFITTRRANPFGVSFADADDGGASAETASEEEAPKDMAKAVDEAAAGDVSEGTQTDVDPHEGISPPFATNQVATASAPRRAEYHTGEGLAVVAMISTVLAVVDDRHPAPYLNLFGLGLEQNIWFSYEGRVSIAGPSLASSLPPTTLTIAGKKSEILPECFSRERLPLAICLRDQIEHILVAWAVHWVLKGYQAQLREFIDAAALVSGEPRNALQKLSAINEKYLTVTVDARAVSKDVLELCRHNIYRNIGDDFVLLQRHPLEGVHEGLLHGPSFLEHLSKEDEQLAQEIVDIEDSVREPSVASASLVSMIAGLQIQRHVTVLTYITIFIAVMGVVVGILALFQQYS